MRRSGSIIQYRGPRGVIWRIRYVDASGRRVIETLGPEPPWTERKSERALRDRLADVDREGYRKPEGVTFREFAQAWFTNYLPARSLKRTTVETYSYARRHLEDFFGDRRLNDLSIRPELVDQYVAAKTRDGLAPKTISNHLQTLGVMLKDAVRWGLIRSNPVTGVARPKVKEREMRVLTEADISRLWAAYEELEQDAGDNERMWWHLARTITFVGLGTALRRGELLALRWRDVQLVEGLVHVRQAFVRGEFTTPKSRTSRRTIEIGPQTVDLLSEYFQASPFQGDDELAFCHPRSGRPLDAGALVADHMRPALIQAGIVKSFRPFHDLRHTALTHEAAAGNPQAYIQLKAGHSQGAITERYVHAAQVMFLGAARRGEDRMFVGITQAKVGQKSGDPQSVAEPPHVL